MGRTEAFLGMALIDFLFSPIVFFFLLFLGRAIFFTTLEILRPARVVSYRTVIRNDLVACVAYVYIIFPLAAYLNHIVPGHHSYLT